MKFKKDKIMEQNRLEYERAMEYFKRLGIDIDELGFPHSNYRTADHISAEYYVYFENIATYPLRIQDGVETASFGTYHTQPMGAIRTKTHWLPGDTVDYEFEIRNGRLKIARKEKTLLQRILAEI